MSGARFDPDVAELLAVLLEAIGIEPNHWSTWVPDMSGYDDCQELNDALEAVAKRAAAGPNPTPNRTETR